MPCSFRCRREWRSLLRPRNDILICLAALQYTKPAIPGTLATRMQEQCRFATDNFIRRGALLHKIGKAPKRHEAQSGNDVPGREVQLPLRDGLKREISEKTGCQCQAKVLGTPKTNVNLPPLPCPRGPREPLGQGRGGKRKLVRYDTVTISTYTGYYRPCKRLTVQESRDCVRSYSRIFRANSRVL